MLSSLSKLARSADARLCAVLVALAVALWLPRLRGPIDLRYDAGVYYLLGTSLAEGNGYRLPNEPGNIQAVQYPPLLPAFVAAHCWAAGTTAPEVVGPLIRRSYLVLFLLYVVAAYGLARQFVRPAFAFLAGLICCLHHYGLFMSDLLFAEIPFALVTALFAVCHVRAARATRAGAGGPPAAADASTPAGRRRFYVAAAALLGTAAYLLRSAGVAVLAAWVGESLLRRQWASAARRAVVAAVPVVCWQGYLAYVTTGAEYQRPDYAYQRAAYQYYNVTYARNVSLLDPFAPELGEASAADVARRVAANLRVMPASLGQAVTAQEEFWRWLMGKARHHLRQPGLPLEAVAWPAAALGGLVLAGGLVLLLGRRQWFVPLYLAASVGLICLTPWPGQFTRYLSPLTPYLALCLVTVLAGLHAAAARRGTRPVRWAATAAMAGIIGLVLGVALFATSMTYGRRLQPVYPGEAPAATGGAATATRQRLFYYDEKWAAFDAAIEWVGRRAAPADVIATSAPHWAYLKTNRRAVMPPMEIDPAKAQILIDSVPATYLVLDELEFLDIVKRYARPMVDRNPAAWERVYTAPGGRAVVYRRVPGGTAGAAGTAAGAEPKDVQ